MFTGSHRLQKTVNTSLEASIKYGGQHHHYKLVNLHGTTFSNFLLNLPVCCWSFTCETSCTIDEHILTMEKFTSFFRLWDRPNWSANSQYDEISWIAASCGKTSYRASQITAVRWTNILPNSCRRYELPNVPLGTETNRIVELIFAQSSQKRLFLLLNHRFQKWPYLNCYFR